MSKGKKPAGLEERRAKDGKFGSGRTRALPTVADARADSLLETEGWRSHDLDPHAAVGFRTEQALADEPREMDGRNRIAVRVGDLVSWDAPMSTPTYGTVVASRPEITITGHDGTGVTRGETGSTEWAVANEDGMGSQWQVFDQRSWRNLTAEGFDRDVNAELGNHIKIASSTTLGRGEVNPDYAVTVVDPDTIIDQYDVPVSVDGFQTVVDSDGEPSLVRANGTTGPNGEIGFDQYQIGEPYDAPVAGDMIGRLYAPADNVRTT